MADIEYSVKGKTIKRVRKMTKKELAKEGWVDTHDSALALVLDDDTVIYASQDYEGNGPGALFGRLKSGAGIYVSE